MSWEAYEVARLVGLKVDNCGMPHLICRDPLAYLASLRSPPACARRTRVNFVLQL